MTLPQTVFFQFLIQIEPVYCTYIWPKNQTYNVASAPTVTGSVFMCIFRLYLEKCIEGSLKGKFSTRGKINFLCRVKNVK